MSDLLRRRSEVVADHQAQEKYDPYWKAEAKEGHRLSERPVAIHLGDEIVFVGDCVTLVRLGFESFLHMVGDTPAQQEKEKREPGFALTVRRAKEVLATPAGPELRIVAERWNSYLPALEAAGLTVVLTHA